MQTLLYLSVLVLAGFLIAKLLGFINLPDVTGYLIAGVLIGPSLLNLIPKIALPELNLLSTIALGFIAYNIGCQIDLGAIKSLGMNIITITILEALIAELFVFIGMLMLGQSVVFSLAISTMACATAPAATLLIIKQYNAKGPLVDTLIPVVALDDAVGIIGIILFGVVSSIAETQFKGVEVSLDEMILAPLFEIFASAALGLAIGFALTIILKFFKKSEDVRIFITGIILITTFISENWGLSSLLTLMSFGIVVGNFSPRKTTAREAINGITPVVYVAFFALSGADLDFSILKTAGLLGLAFFIFRAMGKVTGAGIGAKISKLSPTIQKYLGFTLLPQAGVAIGLSQIAATKFPEPYGSTMRAIVLSAVIISEISGPIISRWALVKAGDIQPRKLNSEKQEKVIEA